MDVSYPLISCWLARGHLHLSFSSVSGSSLYVVLNSAALIWSSWVRPWENSNKFCASFGNNRGLFHVKWPWLLHIFIPVSIWRVHWNWRQKSQGCGRLVDNLTSHETCTSPFSSPNKVDMEAGESWWPGCWTLMLEVAVTIPQFFLTRHYKDTACLW